MSYEKYECFSSAAVFNVGFVSCRLPVTHFSYTRYSPRSLTLSVFLVIDILVRGCSFSSAKNTAPSNGEHGHSGARTLMSLACRTNTHLTSDVCDDIKRLVMPILISSARLREIFCHRRSLAISRNFVITCNSIIMHR